MVWQHKVQVPHEAPVLRTTLAHSDLSQMASMSLLNCSKCKNLPRTLVDPKLNGACCANLPESKANKTSKLDSTK